MVCKFGKFEKFWYYQKWQSFDRNIFEPHRWKTIRIAPQIMFGDKTNSFWVCLQVCQVWEVLVLPKVTKFWTKYFWVVLMENMNHKSCSGVLGGKNQLILGWFASLASMGGFGTIKKIKFWPKYFWVVLMENLHHISFFGVLGEKPTQVRKF